MLRVQANAIQFSSQRKLRGIPLLSLITALSVIAAGCAVTSNTAGLPELPPAPVIATGTFQVANNFVACPAGSTPSNPGASLCAMTSPSGTIDVLTDAFLGSSYGPTVVTTRGGTAPVTSCQIQGTLPSGMVLNAAPLGATCVITGTLAATLGIPVPSGGFVAITLTIRATDSGNPAASDTQDIVIRIFSGFSFTTLAIENGTQGRAYSKILTTDIGGGRGVPPIVSCTATGLPAGMTVGTSGATACALGGTPTVNGSFTVTVTATDSAVPANVRLSPAYPLVVNPPLTVAVPAFTNGTQGRPYIALSVTTAGGQRPLATCTAPALPAGMTIVTNPANTAANVNTCLISGTPTAAGPFNVVVSATDIATPTTAAGTASAASTPLLINPPLTVPAFVIGNSTVLRTFALTVPTAGGNRPLLSCLMAGAPAGLTIALDPANTAINLNNCILGGAPAAGTAANFNVTVTVGDTGTTNTLAGNASSAATALQNNPPLTVPVIPLPNGAEGSNYSATVPTTGGNRPLTACLVTGGPTGLVAAPDAANTAVNVNNCILTGTPIAAATAGTYATLVVTATDTTSTTTAQAAVPSGNFSLIVGGPLAIPAYVIGNGTNGRSFLQDIPVTGGVRPLNAATGCTATGLPTGLTIAVSPGDNCRISGTPTVTVTNQAINITATDTGTIPATASQAGTVTINAPFTVPAFVLGDGTQGRAFTQTIPTSGGNRPLTSCILTGQPGGLAIALDPANTAGNVNNCIISGSPTLAGPFSLTVTVTDTVTTSTASGAANSAATNLTVNAPLAVTAVAFDISVESRAINPILVPITGGEQPYVTCTLNQVGTGGPGVSIGAGTTLVTAVVGTNCRITGTIAAGASGSTAPVAPPTQSTVYQVSVTATDTATTSTLAGMATNAPPASWQITEPLAKVPVSGILGDGVVGRPFNQPSYQVVGGTFTAVFFTVPVGPFTLLVGNVGTPCEGLSVNNLTGAIIGTPVNPGLAPGCDFTLRVSDQATGPNLTTPAGFEDTAITIDIRAALTITTVANTVLDSIAGRAGYTFTFANAGGIAPFTWTNPGGGAATLNAADPECAGLSLSAAGVMSGTPTVPGRCTFDVSVTDSPSAGPTTAAGTTTVTFNVDVRPEFNVTVVAVPDAVAGRNYGIGANCNPGGVTACLSGVATTLVAVAGGSDFQTLEAGNGPPTVCAVTTVTPIGPGTLVTGNLTAVAVGNVCRLQSVGALPAGTQGTYNVTISATDNPIAAVSVPANTRTAIISLTVQPALAMSDNFLGAAAAGNFPDAVTGRSYGDIATFCIGLAPCVPPTFTASGGVGAYLFTPGAYPAPIAAGCTSTATTLTCATAAPVTGGTATPITQVTDAGNAAAPPATVSRSRTVTVRAATASNGNAPGNAPPTAVQGRTYGGTGFTALVYTASSGLGNYVFTNIATVNSPIFSGVPGEPGGPVFGVVCSASFAVMTCGSSGGTDVIPLSVLTGTYNFAVDVSDTSNGTTPSGGAPTLNRSILLNAPLAIGTVALLDGVAGRAITANFITLAVTGGLSAPATCGFGAGSNNGSGGGTLGLGTTLNAAPSTTNCRVNGTVSAAAAPSVNPPTLASDFQTYTLAVTATDTANATTPSGTGTSAGMPWTILEAIQATPPTGTTLGAGVVGRPFTVQIDAAGGIAPLFGTIQAGNFGAPVAGISSGAGNCAGLTINLNTGAIGGTPSGGGACPFTVRVNDTGNAIAAASFLDLAYTLTIQPALTINSAALNNGVADAGTQGRAFTKTYTRTGGTGTFTWSVTGAQFTGLSGNVGTPCQNLTLSAVTGILSGTPPLAGTFGTCGPFTVRVDDTGSTTPSSSVPTTTLPGNATQGQSVTINDELNIPAIVVNFDGTDSRVFIQQFPFTGGNGPFPPAACSATGLPSGNLVASFGGVNCQVTGTPLTADVGAFSLNVTVTDSASTTTLAGSASTGAMPYLINQVLTITTTTLPGVVTGTPYNEALVAVGGNGAGGYTFSEVAGFALSNDADCAGLTLNPLGAVTGTPTAAGPVTCSFTVRVDDTATTSTGAGFDTQALTINVVPPITIALAPELTPVVVANGTVGIAFGTGSGGPVDFLVTGGSGTFTCQTTPALPTGMTFTQSGTNCRMAGTPSVTAVSQAYNVTATDSSSLQVSNTVLTQAFQINAALAIGPVPTLAAGLVHDAVQAQPYLLLIPHSGGQAPRALTNPGGTLATLNFAPGDPDCGGLSLNTATDEITGTGAAPSGTPACPFDLRVIGTATTTTGAVPLIVAHTFTLRPIMTITTTQANIVHGLLNAPYTGMTFATTGGTLNAKTFFDSADVEPAGCNGGALTALPAGLALDATGVLSGTPTTFSAAAPGTAFMVCAQDPGNPAVAAYQDFTPTFSLGVMRNFVYAVDDTNGNDELHVVNAAGVPAEVDTNSPAAGNFAIDLTQSTTATNGQEVAVSPHGRYVWVTMRATDDRVSVFDTISHAFVTFLDLNGGALTCTNPEGIAAQRTPVGDRVVVACANGRVVVLIDPGPTAVPSVTGAVEIDLVGGDFDGVAFNAAGTRAFITDNTNSRLYAIDTSVSPPVAQDLNGATAGVFLNLLTTATDGGQTPRGVVVVPNGANTYAYVAMQAAENTTFYVQVWDVTNASAVTSATNVTNVMVGSTTPAPDEDPFYLAYDSLNNVVYATLNGNDQIVQINNAVVTPTAGRAAITTANRAAAVTTITTRNVHGYTAGQSVTITGNSTGSFNGTFTITAPVTATTFTYAQALGNAAGTDGIADIVGGTGLATTGNAPWGIAVPPVVNRVFTGSNATSDRVDFFDLTAFGTNPTGAGTVTMSGGATATLRGMAAIPVPR